MFLEKLVDREICIMRNRGIGVHKGSTKILLNNIIPKLNSFLAHRLEIQGRLSVSYMCRLNSRNNTSVTKSGCEPKLVMKTCAESDKLLTQSFANL